MTHLLWHCLQMPLLFLLHTSREHSDRRGPPALEHSTAQPFSVIVPTTSSARMGICSPVGCFQTSGMCFTRGALPIAASLLPLCGGIFTGLASCAEPQSSYWYTTGSTGCPCTISSLTPGRLSTTVSTFLTLPTRPPHSVERITSLFLPFVDHCFLSSFAIFLSPASFVLSATAKKDCVSS